MTLELSFGGFYAWELANQILINLRNHKNPKSLLLLMIMFKKRPIAIASNSALAITNLKRVRSLSHK